MTAAPLPNPHSADDSARTLGSLLYADRARVLTTEADWQALVAAIARGDQLALHSLYERAHRLVFTLALRITRSRDTADELTVDVFHDVWRRAASYDAAAGTVVGWIMNQARSRAIDRVRYEQRLKRAGDPPTGLAGGTATPAPGGAMEPGQALEPGEALEADEQTRSLHEALHALTPDERQAIETAFFAQLAHHEVATRLHVPLGTIKSRIRSALVKLRWALGRRDVL